jgi:signal peptidase I
MARRGALEIAWPIFFLAMHGLLLMFLEFAAVLLVAIISTLVIVLVDRFLLRRNRSEDQLEPASVDMAKAFLPVLSIVFLIRSFWIEPFRIPSESMVPTLIVGDFILVNKYAYGVRIPVLNKKVMEVGSVKRGDVVVFRYPLDPTKDYIKRAIGLPGDVVEFQGKNLVINGNPVPVKMIGESTSGVLGSTQFKVFSEKLGEQEHKAQVDEQQPVISPQQLRMFPDSPVRKACEIKNDFSGMRCTVPAGHYMMIGDNRDNSTDSRYWGFVPEDHLRGRAFLVWMNFGSLSRIGESIK